MNPFSPVFAQAENDGLPPLLQPNAVYYHSDAFRNRTLFRSENASKDAVAVSLWMLKHVALAPQYADDGMKYLKKGVLCLKYFGISSPVPFHLYIEDSKDVFTLLKAVQENLDSKMFKAAVRLRAIQEAQQKYMFGSKMIQAEIERFRSNQTWSTSEDYAKDLDSARFHDSQIHAAIDKMADGLKQRRLDRINAISRATAPKITNWHTLLHLICAQVLTPSTDKNFNLCLLYQHS